MSRIPVCGHTECVRCGAALPLFWYGPVRGEGRWSSLDAVELLGLRRLIHGDVVGKVAFEWICLACDKLGPRAVKNSVMCARCGATCEPVTDSYMSLPKGWAVISPADGNGDSRAVCEECVEEEF